MILKPKAISCDTARSMMFDYIDGGLEGADILRFEAHVAECEACRRELDECREMLDTVKKSAYSVPAEFHDGVMNKIANVSQENVSSAKAFRFKPWMGALTAACAALMILIVGRGYIGAGIGEADVADDKAGEYARIEANQFDSPNVSGDAEPSGNIPSEQHGGETMVTVATDSFAGFSPNIADKDKLSDSDNSEQKDSSLLDLILGEFTDSDIAVLVCRKSDFEGIIPDTEPTTVIIEEAVYERYVVSSDAMVAFTGYLELLENLSIDYRAAVPDGAEFEVCEIYLLVDGEK